MAFVFNSTPNNLNQTNVFNPSNNVTSQNQTSFGTSGSQFNSSFNSGQSVGFGASTNLTSKSNFFSAPTNTFSNNNTSIPSLNSTNNSMFGTKSSGSTFGVTSSQNNLNLGNQNAFTANNANTTPFNTFGSANVTQPKFGPLSNPVASQSSLGFFSNPIGPTSNINATSGFGNPLNTSSNANSNVFGNSQTSNFFQGTSNVSNSILSTPQSSLTFGSGSALQTSNFPTASTQPISTSTVSNVLGVAPANTFGFPSSTSNQSTLNVTQAASQSPFSFGSSKSNSIHGSNNITSTSNLSAPLTSLPGTFTLSTPGTSLMSTSIGNKTTTTAPFLHSNSSTSSSISQIGFGNTSTGLGGISSSKIQVNNASPLASSSVSAKKGLGGSPISDSSKSVIPKDAAQKISVVKQAKDIDILPELKETVENFKKFVTDQKKLREEIIKSNEVVNLITRVEEESHILRQSISDVANGLQKIQVQSNKLRSDICKEQSNIKIAQTSSDASMILDRSESSSYFSNKVRELENRAGLYLQEIEVVESMCNSSNKSALTTKDLVEIIRKMDDEFIGIAAKLYMVHERVKTAKTEYLRRYKQTNNYQNPFLAIEGRFGDTFESIKGLNNSTYKKSNIPNSVLKISDTVGGSPFDNSCYINQNNSFSIPKSNNNIQKPSIFGLNNNNNQITISSTTSAASPFSFSTANSSFTLNKPPTSLFLNDAVSNKKRR